MNRLAHDGYDTFLVFVKGPNLTPRGECDLNVLIASAARYGLDVYAYSYMVSEKHPPLQQGQCPHLPAARSSPWSTIRASAGS